MNTSAKNTIAAAIDEVVALARRVVPPKMTAAVLYGSEDLRIEEIDVPSLAADEVLLRVRLALTDGTDLKVWKRGYHAKMIRPPAVFGHEVVGEVVAVGKRVDARWRMGIRVVAANSAPCFRCYHCRRGQENLCEDLCSTTAPMPSTCAYPGASSPKICWKCRTLSMTKVPRWSNHWPACCAAFMKWKCAPATPLSS